MSEYAKLLSEPINFAVVQLPQRHFPGVVVQGDTLFSLVQQLNQMSRLLAENDLDHLDAEIADIKEVLRSAVSLYEHICAINGIELPYSR